MGRNLWAIMYVTVMILMIIQVVESNLHRVGGGRYTWNSDVNYSDWSNNQTFYSGDWLYFGFDRKIHNILQVNKSSYEKCIDTDFIFNITRGGRDVFQLVQPKPYYFICGRGFCLKGMKLAVNVLPQPPRSTPTSPITPASTAISLIHSNAFTVAILTLAFKVLYFD
ncbi:Early nodulin-like protein 20 [Cardamine amara subsp. amara]|uniref:Early nodulin-like protein 20 n=1 Tax=Cardamine amara subsp. amara TaxID=228776 RepID=A0ABD1AQ27_CARAN